MKAGKFAEDIQAISDRIDLLLQQRVVWRAAALAWAEWDEIAADDGFAEEADSLLTEARRLTNKAKKT